jgi:hypothetical protein
VFIDASQDGLPHRRARLTSEWLASLSGGIDYPLDPNERFQVISFSFLRLRPMHPNSELSTHLIPKKSNLVVLIRHLAMITCAPIF